MAWRMLMPDNLIRFRTKTDGINHPVELCNRRDDPLRLCNKRDHPIQLCKLDCIKLFHYFSTADCLAPKCRVLLGNFHKSLIYRATR